LGFLDWSVTALDGWLCRIKVPTAKDTANIGAYLSVRSLGGTGDSRTFHCTSLKDFLESLKEYFMDLMLLGIVLTPFLTPS
jgi:hypothetical protein